MDIGSKTWREGPGEGDLGSGSGEEGMSSDLWSRTWREGPEE